MLSIYFDSEMFSFAYSCYCQAFLNCDLFTFTRVEKMIQCLVVSSINDDKVRYNLFVDSGECISGRIAVAL